MRVLLLCQYDVFQAQAVCDHIDALSQMPGCEVDVLSFGGDLPDRLRLDYYDVIVVHYSSFIYENRCLSPLARWRLRCFGGLKAVFLHDEYKHVDLTTRALLYLDAQVLFTVIPEHAWPVVYPRDRIGALKLVNVLTGYVPRRLEGIASPKAGARPIDIGYRGRIYPAWHGRAGRRRVEIGQLVKRRAAEHGLHTDIAFSEARRLYGKRWTAFLGACKATLGTESDVSVIDRTGDIARAVESHQRLHPEASYDELRRRYFAEVEGKVSIGQISPRIFEAIALRSLLVLTEGRYSGVIEPGVHFLPLRDDCANFDEIVAVLKDPDQIDGITERAYRDVIASRQWSYDAFASAIGARLWEQWQRLGLAPAADLALPPPERSIFGNHRSALHRHVLRARGRLLGARLLEASTVLLGAGRQQKLKTRIKALLDRGRIEAGTAMPAVSASLARLHAHAKAIALRVGRPALQITLDPVDGKVTLEPHDRDASARPDGSPLQHGEAEVRAVVSKGRVSCIWLGGEPLGLAAALLSHEPLIIASNGCFAETEAVFTLADLLHEGWQDYARVTIRS